jgi:hypothetical protein
MQKPSQHKCTYLLLPNAMFLITRFLVIVIDAVVVEHLSLVLAGRDPNLSSVCRRRRKLNADSVREVLAELQLIIRCFGTKMSPVHGGYVAEGKEGDAHVTRGRRLTSEVLLLTSWWSRSHCNS